MEEKILNEIDSSDIDNIDLPLNENASESLGSDELQLIESDDVMTPSDNNSLFSEDNIVVRLNISANLFPNAPIILITNENVPAVALNKLKERFNLVFINKNDTQEVILQKVVDVSAIFYCGHSFKLDKAMLDFIGDKLTVVGLMSAGYDHIDVRELVRRKIKIGNTRSVLTDSVAEVALGLALAVSHRFKEGYLSCTKGKWVTGEPNWLLGKQLSGSVIGIVGFGDIGQAIALRLVPFHVKRIVYSGHGKKKTAQETWSEFVEFEELLSVSDFVFVACPLTDETKYMFNYQTFTMMKPSCVLVNVGRGAVIKTDDLVKALHERLLWGAGLDVADPEPLPKDHPLLHLDNCFVSPHIGSATLATREAMALLTADNIIAGLEGQPMPSEVCFKPISTGQLDSATNSLYRTPAKHTIQISSTTL